MEKKLTSPPALTPEEERATILQALTEDSQELKRINVRVERTAGGDARILSQREDLMAGVDRWLDRMLELTPVPETEARAA
jgi:hypothetical protein